MSASVLTRGQGNNWVVQTGKYNDRLPGTPIPNLIDSINALNNTVSELKVANETTQKLLQQHMTVMETHGKLLADMESRLKQAESNQEAINAQIRKQASVIHEHDVQLDYLEQSTLANDALLTGPLIDQFVKENPGITFGCSFSEPSSTALISQLVNSEMAKADTEARNISIVAYSKFQKKKAPGSNATNSNTESSTVMVTFGSSHEKLHLIRTLAKKKLGNLFCTERLTKPRQDIHYHLRQLKNRFPDSDLRVLTRSGSPVVRFGDKGKTRAIRTPIELEAFSKWFISKFAGKENSLLVDRQDVRQSTDTHATPVIDGAMDTETS